MSETTKNQITMMSMNINGQAGWYADEPAKQWRARAPIVRGIVEQRRPDIVCWQEFGVTCRQDVLEHSAHPLEFYMGELAGDIYINPISWNPDTFRALAQRTFWLTADGNFGPAWEGAERGCSVVLLEHNDTGEKCQVYNVHLDNKSGRARKEAINLIVQDIGQQAVRYATIVAGDFNISTRRIPGKEQFYNPEPLTTLTEHGFIDVMEAAAPEHGVPLPTFHAYLGKDFHHDHDPFGVWDPDHIFVRDLGVVKTRIVGPGDDGDVPQPSDHYPLEATLSIQGQ